MMDCLFCDIIALRSSGYKVAENDSAVAILDIHPISDGHTLILSKKHIIDLHELDMDTGAKVLELAKLIAKTLKEEFYYEGISLMQSNGFCQDVPHFHLHVFGRKKEDDISITYPDGILENDEHLKAVAKKMQQLPLK